jgi:hypothetical protein
MPLSFNRTNWEIAMLHRGFILALVVVAANVLAGQDAAKPAMSPLVPEERSTEWLIAIEKLRTLPRPGDLQNASVFANIADVIETTPEQKASIVAAMKAYDAAMVQKAAQWESEMKSARAETEAKIVALLPEARRAAAKKALDYSHDQWVTPYDFEARLRADFLKRKEKADDVNVPKDELEAYRKEFMNWLQTQRQKSREKNADVAKNVKALLDPKEAERLSEFDKNKEVPPPPKKEKK